MKKKKIIKVLASVMSLAMMLSACGQTTTESTNESAAKESSSKPVESTEPEKVEESKWPEYLNMDSTYPVIKEGYEDEVKKLSVAVVMESGSGEWENLWVSKFLKDKYNIELEVEYIMNTALEERKNLMMNSGELPDLMWNMKFTTDELTRYGAQDGLFLACDEYISEELTPNLYSYLSEDILAAITTPDGHIYSLPNIKDETDNMMSYNRYFINGEYLKAAGIEEAPKTLDEFTEVMYKLKEADVAGVGSENFYPIGGGMEQYPVTSFLLNAFGYNSHGDNYGLNPTLRDGEVVIPVYDMDVYKEFLTLMNQYYKDGIINPNYFTIEKTECDSQLHNGQNAVFGTVVFTTGLETWNEWDAITPLTSDWQEEPEAYNSVPLSVGGYVVSAETEYPELCMRLADIFYDAADCRAFWGGTGEGTEYDYDGYLCFEWLPDKNNYAMDAEKLPEGYSAYTYLLEYMHGCMLDFGSYRTREAIVNIAKANGGDLPVDVRETFDMSNPDHQWREEMFDKVLEYVEYSYPTIYYASEEKSNKITDLKTIIEPYAKEQIALFITGGRDLSEVDVFVKELEDMGMDELLQIYKDLYNIVQ